jgi:iron-sulfur cluster assembly protein
MTLNITVTDAANTYIKKMIEKSHGVGFRLSIKKTGCSGFAYHPSVVEKINPADHVLTMGSDLNIYVDTAWLDLLQNLQVDYVEDEKLGLKQKRLVFTNPKEGDRCGCGESFHITKQNEE